MQVTFLETLRHEDVNMDMALATIRRCAEAGRYVTLSTGEGLETQLAGRPQSHGVRHLDSSPQDQLGLLWSPGAVVTVQGNPPSATGTPSPPGVVA